MIRDTSSPELRQLLLTLLEKQPRLRRKALIERCVQLLGATPQELRDHSANAAVVRIKSRLGMQLTAMLQSGVIDESEAGFLTVNRNSDKLSERERAAAALDDFLREARDGGDLCKCFLGAVHTKGGEWLELYTVQLLEKYYTKLGKTVTRADVTGGSNDGGIDGVVETTDWLGFREVTLLQMKNRTTETSAKDVREFYGAVCAANGTRGIFVTASRFHSEAQKLLVQVPNLIGIDGRRLFEIAAFCNYGVLSENGVQGLDEALFLIDK